MLGVTAFVPLLIRVDWHLEETADFLLIGCGTMKQWLRASGLRARVQPSLFDGVDRIDQDFDPWRKRRGLRRGFGQVPAAQAVPDADPSPTSPGGRAA